jgi:tetratricopeptide (TPR) repeat protein
MRWSLVVISAIALLRAGAAEAASNESLQAWWGGCVHPITILDQIAACTNFRESGTETRPLWIARAFFLRASAYLAQRNYTRAIEDCDQAIRLDPKLANAFAGRGSAYRANNEFDRAIRDFDEAIRLNPNFAFASTSAPAHTAPRANTIVRSETTTRRSASNRTMPRPSIIAATQNCCGATPQAAMPTSLRRSS